MANPVFWADPASEPKRSYRWLMRFNINGVNDISHFLVTKVDRPQWNLTESKHQFLNHTFYYPGRVEYQELTATVVDAVQPNSAINFQRLLYEAGYVSPTDASENFGTVSKVGWGAAGAGLGKVDIVQLDAEGTPLETWSLFNSWIKSCKPSQLSYESDDLLNVELTLRYDYFKIETSPNLRDIVGSPGGAVRGLFL